MGDTGTGCRADQAGHSGIAKQIEDSGRISAQSHVTTHSLIDPGPVGGLLREEGQVPKGCQARLKPRLVPGQRPGFWGRAARKSPPASILLI